VGGDGRIVVSRGPEELRAWYRRYNEVCNGHRFDELDVFVAEDVVVNGERQGIDGYVAGLRAVVEAFPDYRWDLRHLVVEGPWIAAHFVDTGTRLGTFRGVPPTGRPVTTQEFAMYRVDQERIVEVWVTADNAPLLDAAEEPRD
jgi:predicted ester cyclase